MRQGGKLARFDIIYICPRMACPSHGVHWQRHQIPRYRQQLVEFSTLAFQFHSSPHSRTGLEVAGPGSETGSPFQFPVQPARRRPAPPQQHSTTPFQFPFQPPAAAQAPQRFHSTSIPPQALRPQPRRHERRVERAIPHAAAFLGFGGPGFRGYKFRVQPGPN